MRHYIGTLKTGLSELAEKAREAEEAGQYEKAAAFEERAKAIADSLSELRGLEGQIKDKTTVTGDFNARAMEAMLRGGGDGDKIQRDQLQVMQDMDANIVKLIAKTGFPNILAVE